MRIPGAKTARAFSRWVQARVLGGALILGYHRVANVLRDEYEVCVTPEHFAEQMAALSKFAHPIQLSELVRCLKEGSLPPKSVAVTFDDGYADNLYEAKPVLEKYAIPATVFVCTGYAGREFWWDELDRLVMSSQSALGALRLEVEKNLFIWDQPEVSPEAGLDVRRKFCHALYNFLLALDVEEQSQAMDMIRRWSGVSSNETTVRALTHDELLQLADGGSIEIGAHTRHHPMLPRLALERQREEIVLSKQDLENLLGKRVNGFAYPNGRATDAAKRIVREAGFAFACTSLHDVVRPAHDLHELTRFWQKDVNGEQFLQGLRLWMKGG
jgi:peptidoglycan/xylan/chitin deacetylase (PgdA/CDA1 family)